MGIRYLEGRPWNEWSREERLFCSALYAKARTNPGAFAEWLNREAQLGIATSGSWDIGYEVCFYRDYLWRRNLAADKYKVSLKRTFDLCLFGEDSIVIIEAKVFEAFDRRQNEDFRLDRDRIRRLPELHNINVKLVALATTRYFENQKEHGDPEMLSMFDGRITWAQVARDYPDELFRFAEALYKPKRAQART